MENHEKLSETTPKLTKTIRNYPKTTKNYHKPSETSTSLYYISLYPGWEKDDQHKNTNMNDKDHLVEHPKTTKNNQKPPKNYPETMEN